MPELPEVQTIVTDLGKILPGLTITDVWTDHKNMFLCGQSVAKSFEAFKKEVVGKNFLSVSRRAKNILIHLSSNKTILTHLKMTGHFLYGKWKKEKNVWIPPQKNSISEDPYNRFIHLIFFLNNGKQLALCDARKFAKVVLFPTNQLSKLNDLKKLGPEPFDKNFTLNFFEEKLKQRKGEIKTLLMDQTFFAGVGNIYSDEILWTAGIHPLRQASKLNSSEIKKIYQSIRPILSKAIELRGDSYSDYRVPSGAKGGYQRIQKAYQLTGTECQKKDGGIIEKIKVGGRSAHFCPIHQKP